LFTKKFSAVVPTWTQF